MVPEDLLFHYAALFDTGFLAGEIAQVVKFGTTNLTVLVHGDGVDKGRFEGEDTLNADVVGHLADGETLLDAFTRNAYHYAAVLLNTLLVAFLDAVSHCDGVAGEELFVLLAGGKGLFGNLDKIHFAVI